ncbi:hypothetical protein D1822_11950 [Phaeobacter inhibens]|uniref:DUF6455 family protein n=1 Tax=Phaeobacter inhibens TaxID=221822 RepID=UPI0001632AE3|nr:DUF6455 family protein [Phaeobacter inhibens]AFO92126.1 hypothetical protein PGA1_c24410 [Phaeobacter inhibens DSM 17395]AUQ46809.1 hypothetical protein PhaeoP10_02482 [Phaeobacter inhibens]AUQ59227.1 hypothetical protein PhaeoP30_02328 [Phaeobacter inhibens]AXT23475.1 hypothetical protein D1822_11950 [Phaeobacter inhibens]
MTSQTNETSRGDLKTHATLFDSMAETVGLDLQEEAISGRLRFDEISEAVLRCTRCGGVSACRKWLDKGLRPGAEAPDFCRNRDLLAYLNEDEV